MNGFNHSPLVPKSNVELGMYWFVTIWQGNILLTGLSHTHRLSTDMSWMDSKSGPHLRTDSLPGCLLSGCQDEDSGKHRPPPLTYTHWFSSYSLLSRRETNRKEDMVRTCNSRTRVAVHFLLSSPPPPSGYNTGTQIFCDLPMQNMPHPDGSHISIVYNNRRRDLC